MDAAGRSRVAGAAGLAGLAVFLVLHASWITPIWEIAPVGALLATIGGTATAAAVRVLLPPAPRSPALLLAALGYPWLVLGPGFVVSDLAGRAGAPAWVVASAFVLAVVGMGTALGMLAGGKRAAVRKSVLAALLLAIGPGHNVPMLAATDAVGCELVILAAAFSTAAITLGAADAWYARRADGVQSAESGDVDAG